MKTSKEFYYTLREILQQTPFANLSMKDFLMNLLELEDESDLANYRLPNNLSSSVYNELLSLIYGRYNKDYVVKITKLICEYEPSNNEVQLAYKEWGYRFISLLNMTYEYYFPLLEFYRSAKDNLMDDITATTNNSVKFNDTPQNPNTSEVYEGDNYITNFTKSHGTTSSPMMSKIMRLKEIQDNYKNVLYDWVKQFEKLFYSIED